MPASRRDSSRTGRSPAWSCPPAPRDRSPRCPSGGTDEITRKCDCRRPSQSSAAKVELTWRKSRPISNATCRSSLGKTRLTELIKQVYLLGSGKPTFPPGVLMHDRSALGPADVTDEQLGEMVADLLGADPAETTVLDSIAEEFPYDLPAITTAGRYWVSGTAEVGGAPKPFRMFVKHVQSWARHPFFAMVPPEQREWAADDCPLADRGTGLPLRPRRTTPPRTRHAARARRLRPRRGVQRGLAGGGPRRRSRVGPDALHPGGQAARPARHQCPRDGAARQRRAHHDDPDLPRRAPVDGRPADDPRRRASGSTRSSPARSTTTFTPGCVEAADRSAEYAEELGGRTIVASHGDACPNNLLARVGTDDFVLIDYGFWGPGPIGYDLSQLLVGDVQLGRRSSDDLAAGRGSDLRRLHGRAA